MVAEGGVDPDTLGRATWTFLHTLAATHPPKPTGKQQEQLKRFMKDFADVYPCAPCAESFREIIKQHPADTKTGPVFADWMCKVHNEVNKEVGKESFDCRKVGERWGVCEQCAAHKDELDDFKSVFKEFQGLRKMPQ